MNLVRVWVDANGWNGEVKMLCGFTETIEGLYDRESAMSWGNMHLTYHSSNRRHCRNSH